MKKKLDCILLVDDEEDCNFFHTRILRKMDCVEHIKVALDGEQALDYLKSDDIRPDIIFLDINMPRMNGWEFLEEYKLLPKNKKAQILVMMLTSSLNPDDRERVEAIGELAGFESKFLDEEKMALILDKYFPSVVSAS